MTRPAFGLLLVAACARAPAPVDAPAQDHGATPQPAVSATEPPAPDQPDEPATIPPVDAPTTAIPPDLAAILGVVDGITFDDASDTLRMPASRPALEQIVEVLQRYPDVRLEIAVHSDDSDDRYGRCLTCNRAKRIRDHLVSRGIAAGRLDPVGYGADRPIDTNTTAAGRARNRRIELHLRE